MSSRFTTLAESISVGSKYVGIKDLSGPERRALFQFVSPDPFEAQIFATLDFDYQANVGSNWFDVTHRIFADGDDAEAEFVTSGGNKQRRKNGGSGLSITEQGVYAFDDGFMPGAFAVNVTTITSGSPLKILFGV